MEDVADEVVEVTKPSLSLADLKEKVKIPEVEAEVEEPDVFDEAIAIAAPMVCSPWSPLYMVGSIIPLSFIELKNCF